MPTSPTTHVIDHLFTTVLREGAGLGDGELLGRFLERHDEAALAALVRRHGPMVWGVCRRLLGHHDAEDAFQATFLVLVRKAPSVVPRELVGNWLYGVARQTALQARRTAARRKAREVQVKAMPDTEAAQQDQWSDVQPLLDEELSRLPDIYRAVLVLCDLEGRTRKEVARQLDVPEGTVAGRLARARALLAKRLTARGVTLSGGALAAVLARNLASASVPDAVVSNTINVANLFATGKAAAAGTIPARVAALAEGVMKAMLFSKLKVAFVLLFVLGILGWGAGVAVRQAQAAIPLVELPAASPAPDLGGTWQGEDWGTVALRPAKGGGFEGTYTDTFGTDVGRIAVRWSAASRRHEGTWSEGKFRFGRIALEAAKDGKAITGAYTTDPKCEHQPGVPSLASVRWTRVKPTAEGTGKGPDKQDQGPVKEAFTAWGKEVGGLQAGLGFRPGEKRAYSHGETVKLVVRVRNVGKDEVKFQYLRQFFIETPPTVTDGEGKPVPLGGVTAFGFHTPVEVTLGPGKVIELYEWERALRPAKWIGNDGVPSLHGAGKFGVQYERILGNSSSGQFKPDPILSKLATGKLELEIGSAPPAAEGDKAGQRDAGKADLPRPGARREADRSITIRVVIDRVNAGSRAITASCVALGVIDGERKPLRLENLSVSKFATIRIKGKEAVLADLKPGTDARLELDGRETTLTVIGIEVPGDTPLPGATEKK